MRAPELRDENLEIGPASRKTECGAFFSPSGRSVNMPSVSLVGHRDVSFPLKNVRTAVLGYGPAARTHALALRSGGGVVSVGLRFGGMSWVRARADGFPVECASAASSAAELVVVLVPDDEQPGVYCQAIEPHVAPGALIVFGNGVGLATGVFTPKNVDAVFVAGDSQHCRVAVHHDATGRAVERAAAYARAVFGPDTTVGTTTIEAEADVELASMAEHVGGFSTLLKEVDRFVSRATETHAPDEAKLAFYTSLRDLIEARVETASIRGLERRSGTSLRGEVRFDRGRP